MRVQNRLCTCATPRSAAQSFAESKKLKQSVRVHSTKTLIYFKVLVDSELSSCSFHILTKRRLLSNFLPCSKAFNTHHFAHNAIFSSRSCRGKSSTAHLSTATIDGLGSKAARALGTCQRTCTCSWMGMIRLTSGEASHLGMSCLWPGVCLGAV